MIPEKVKGMMLFISEGSSHSTSFSSETTWSAAKCSHVVMTTQHCHCLLKHGCWLSDCDHNRRRPQGPRNDRTRGGCKEEPGGGRPETGRQRWLFARLIQLAQREPVQFLRHTQGSLSPSLRNYFQMFEKSAFFPSKVMQEPVDKPADVTVILASAVFGTS